MGMPVCCCCMPPKSTSTVGTHTRPMRVCVCMHRGRQACSHRRQGAAARQLGGAPLGHGHPLAGRVLLHNGAHPMLRSLLKVAPYDN